MERLPASLHLPMSRPKHDREATISKVFLATHEWDPYLTRMEQAEGQQSATPDAATYSNKETGPQGWEVGYRHFTINGKCLGYGEPIRVKEGQRILFHFLNTSATESVRLALPGHRFQVVALDANPVPRPQTTCSN